MPTTRKPLRRALTAALIAVAAVAIGAVFGAGGLSRAATTAEPGNTSPPTIGGTAQEGETLTADHGQWSGNPQLRRSSGEA